jgi:hypothetical protein
MAKIGSATALDADSKLIVQWFVGGCGGYCAKLFIEDLKTRLRVWYNWIRIHKVIARDASHGGWSH